jgi:hypothetical protein
MNPLDLMDLNKDGKLDASDLLAIKELAKNPAIRSLLPANIVAMLDSGAELPQGDLMGMVSSLAPQLMAGKLNLDAPQQASLMGLASKFMK